MFPIIGTNSWPQALISHFSSRVDDSVVQRLEMAGPVRDIYHVRKNGTNHKYMSVETQQKMPPHIEECIERSQNKSEENNNCRCYRIAE